MIFPEIDFYELAISFEELSEICRKLLNGIRMKEVDEMEFVTFDINDTFCFVLEGSGIGEAEQENRNIVSTINNRKTRTFPMKRYSTITKNLPYFKRITFLPY